MKYLYLVLAITFLISACKKSKTKEELLEGDWKLNALTINPPQVVSGNVITDWYSQLLPAIKTTSIHSMTIKLTNQTKEQLSAQQVTPKINRAIGHS